MPGRTLLLALFAFSTCAAQILPPDQRCVPPKIFRGENTLPPFTQPISRRITTVRLGPGKMLRVPQQYSTIQLAIDAAADGDTVLVSEGRYFENIRYRGKAIVVASTYLIDADTTHIENTVIDGSRHTHPDSGSVVYFIDGEDTTSVLCGFTITGGTGTAYFFGIFNTWAREGGGVYCESAGARLTRNLIMRNRVVASSAGGGGLATMNIGAICPCLILERNRISDNYVRGDSAGTWGYSGGADINGTSVRAIGNIFERDTVVGRNFAVGGGMTVYGPIGNEALPEALIQGNIFRNNTVSTSLRGGLGGAMAITGTSLTYVMDNVFEGNRAISDGGWAQGGGLVVEDSNIPGHGRRIVAHNQFVSNSVSCRDGPAQGGGVLLYNTTATISKNTFRYNRSSTRERADGAALATYHSSFRIDGNTFLNNIGQPAMPEGGGGGALAIFSDPPQGGEEVVANNLFSGNVIGWGGGAILSWGDPSSTQGLVIIASNTIVGNRARSVGGGIVLLGIGNRLLMNNILWDDIVEAGGWVPSEINFWDFSGSAQYYHNNIKGGWQTGVGNISVQPGFAPGSFSLSDTSGCIGAGIDSVRIDSIWIHAPDDDFLGSARPTPHGSSPDIGALESPLAIGTNQPAMILAPVSHDFRNVHPGTTSDTLTVVVTNRGVETIGITGFFLARSEFGFAPQLPLPVMISSCQSMPLKIVFRPTVPGSTVCDSLVLTTTDRFRPRLVVRLSGRGAAAIQTALAGTLYGISGPAGGPQLFSLNKSNGLAQLIAQFSPAPPAGLSAFTARPIDHMLYGAFSSAAKTDLYRLSSACGDAEFAGTVPVGNVTTLAISPSDALYLVTREGRIYRGGIGSSDTVFVGPAGHAFTGLAFSPATGVLWASVRDSLFTLDTLTGAATLRGANTWNVPHSSITFNSLGTMYGLYSTTLVAIDKVTGKVSEIGSTGDAELFAIAMRCIVPTGVDDGQEHVGLTWRLDQSYPNPFNPSTTISYGLPEASYVSLKVYNTLGEEVASLVNGETPAGRHEVRWNADGMASGVYLYRIQAGTFVSSRKMLLLK